MDQIRYFFHGTSRVGDERKEKLVALAYDTARDAIETPVKIFIRSDIHSTTSVSGYIMDDPNGWHATFSFKDSKQVETGYHVTAHGYTAGKDDFKLTKAIAMPAKKDTTRKRNGQRVWPPEEELLEFIYHPKADSSKVEQEHGENAGAST